MSPALLRIVGCLLFPLALMHCGAPKADFGGTGGTGHTEKSNVVGTQSGKASWYGKRFQGRKTASGQPFDRHDLTAAHKKLRFGTRVRVTNLKNNKQVVVRINDRGPYSRGRIIDLSERAAEILQMKRAGVVPVKIEVLAE